MLAAVATAGCDRDGPGDICAYWLPKLDDAAQRVLAVRNLGAHGCREAQQRVAALIRDPVASTEALHAVVALGRTPAAEAAVIEAVKIPALARDAARQAVEWGLTEATGPLASALDDPRFGAIRRALAEALLDLGGARRAAPTLAKTLAALPARREQTEAPPGGAPFAARLARALGEALPSLALQPAQDVARALAAFAARATLTPDDAAGRAALGALLAAPPGARGAVWGAAAQEVARAQQTPPGAERPTVRPVTLALLWGLSPTRAAAVALEALQAPAAGDEARLAAAALLWAARDPAAAEALERALEGARTDAPAAARGPSSSRPSSPSPAPEPAGERALVPLALAAGGPETAPRLAEVLARATGERRAAAATALALLTAPDAVPSLAERLADHPSALVRQVPARSWFRAAAGLARGEAPWAGLATTCHDMGPALRALQDAQRAAATVVSTSRTEAAAVAEADTARAKDRLAALRGARDAAYAATQPLEAATRALRAARARAILGLRRAPRPRVLDAVTEATSGARTPACGSVRWWAVAALVRAGAPPTEGILAQLDAQDPALAFVLRARARGGRPPAAAPGDGAAVGE